MKLKIDTETLIDEFFENTCLLGIVAPIKDYLFSWHINQTMGYNFKVNHNIEIQLRKKERNYFFSIYEYKIFGSPLIHYLYNNEDDGEYLLPEFKHLDFLWLAKGETMGKDEISDLQKLIKSLPNVQLVVEMTNEKIRNKQSLLF